MKKIGKLKILILILFAALFVSTTGLFAYFVSRSDSGVQEIETGDSITPEFNIIEINNETDLKINAIDLVFLSDSLINNGKTKIFKLMSDIVLTDDLVIEADVNIDFNGNYIDLNGNNLTIRHNYISNLTLFNGSVIGAISEDDASQNPDIEKSALLYIETDLAAVYFENFYVNGYDDSNEEFLDYVKFKYSFEVVFDRFREYFDSITDNYYIDDLPFITSYKHYPFTIKYESDNEDIIDEFGRVTRPSGNIDKTVTVTVTVSDSDNSGNFEKSFIVLSEDSDYLAVMNNLLDKIVWPYLIEKNVLEQIIIDDEITLDDGDYYIYFNDIYLPKANSYYGFDFIYEVSYDASDTFVSLNDSVLRMKTKSGFVSLRATVKLGDITVTETFNFYSCLNNDFEIAKNAIELLDIILVYSQTDPLLDLIPEVLDNYISDIKRMLGTDFSIAVSVPDNNYVEIVQDEERVCIDGDGEDCAGCPLCLDMLRVKNIPGETDPKIYVDYTFTFANGLHQIVKPFKVFFYSVTAGAGDKLGVSGYDLLYYELVSLINSQSDTIKDLKDFSLPTVLYGSTIKYVLTIEPAIVAKYPYVAKVGDDPGIFLNNLVKFVPEDDGSDNYQEKIESYEGIDFLQLGIGNMFNLDPKKVPPENFMVYLDIYFDTELGTATQALYSKQIAFELPGIYRSSRDIPDRTLFYFMMKTFSNKPPSDFASFDADDPYSFIRVDDIKYSDKDIFIIDSPEADIESYNGLQYMVTVKKFKFNNISNLDNLLYTPNADANKMFVSSSIIKTNVVELEITNCGITDINLAVMQNMQSLVHVDLSNNDLRNLSGLPALSTVERLVITNNPITSLENLTAFYMLSRLTMDTFLDNETAPQIDFLMNLKKLKSIILVGDPLNPGDYDSANGKWDEVGYAASYVNMNKAFAAINFTKYVMIYNRGTRFYYSDGSSYNDIHELYHVAKPTDDETTCASVLEAIFYFELSRTVQLPKKLTNNHAVPTTYIISWTYDSALTDLGNADTLLFSGLTVDTKLVLIASVTVGGTTMTRAITITVK